MRFALGDADEQVLRAFLHEAQALEDSLLRQGGFAASYHVSWKIGQPLVITGTEPNADQRAVMLHRLRPFLLQGESLYFHSVRGILARSSDSPFLHDWLRQTKARFTCKHSQQQFLISVGDMVLNSEAALNQWLNAFEYHREEAKAIDLIMTHDPFPVDASRPIFIMMLREKVDAVLHLGHVVHKMLSDPAGLAAPDA
ncbi:MAG: hypothetical protein NTW87_12330 [Planctomycetota bacterium]|nr:hypothetical protein [Planctomycetota bacterium]